MNFLVLFGSPRKQGNTASLLAPFIDELNKAGHDVEYVDVYEKNIAGCRACLKCQKNENEINCVINDDMDPILGFVGKADIIVIAAPIYLWSVPAPVKAVMDRMVYSSCRYYGSNPLSPSLIEGKKLAFITTCGFPLEKAADLCEESLKRFCKYCGMEYMGMLAERQRKLTEAFMDEIKAERARGFAQKISN